MNNNHKTPRGQALVLIAFAIIGLVGMTALAIDGGNVYSDRRHAQNAADTAALAAGLAQVRQQADWQDVGYARAADNGYNDNGTTNTVDVELCSTSPVSCTLPDPLPAGETAADYVQVIITSHVRTYFAPVLGIGQLTNRVQAVVHASQPKETKYANGSPLASLMEGCKPQSWSSPPFTVGGSVQVTVSGAPVFDNSSCEPDFISNISNGVGVDGSFTSAEGICLYGTYENKGGNPVSPTPQEHCGTQVDRQTYQALDSKLAADCAALGSGQITGSGGNYDAYPGNYSDIFPNVSPAGTLRLHQGLYCLNHGLKLASTWTITTDLNNNGQYDANEGVLLYAPSDEITFNGGSTIHIHAVTAPGCDQEGYNGLLIYLPLTNDSTVKIAGGNSSTFTGTILAPASLITLEGGSGGYSDTLDLETQLLGYSVSIGGGGTLKIHYDACVTATFYTNPQLQPYK